MTDKVMDDLTTIRTDVAELRDQVRRVRALTEQNHDELTAHRELAGRAVQAAELLKRMTVTLDDERIYDHDTIVMLNDQERAMLRWNVEKAAEDIVRSKDHMRRKQWHDTIWGRTAVVGGIAMVAMEALNLWVVHR